jgi:hypothetical protein
MMVVDPEGKTLEEALAAFQHATGFKAGVVTRETKIREGLRPDATIEIEVNKKRLRYLVEIKTVDRAVALTTVKHQLEAFGRPGLLVAPYITDTLAHLCRAKLDLQFIDTVGNAYLRAPGLYIFIRGERPRGPAAAHITTRAGGTATALRMVFALLCRPHLFNAPYREIAATAGIALGAVGWVFFDLHQRHYVTGNRGTHNRRLLEPARLLEEWVTNFPIKLRPKLNVRRFRAPDPDWWQNARLTHGALWGGEVAAHTLTGYLKPATYTIYVDPTMGRDELTRLVQEHRLRADHEGDVEILDRFWTFPADPTRPGIVPPLLVYADLLATLDPRNLEAAKQVREKHLEHALHNT